MMRFLYLKAGLAYAEKSHAHIAKKLGKYPSKPSIPRDKTITHGSSMIRLSEKHRDGGQ
jgi:hypothetical protein